MTVHVNPVRLLAQSVLLNLCLTMVPRSVEGAANLSIDFLRKVVAPVEVPQHKTTTTTNGGETKKKKNSIRMLTSAELKEESQKRKKRREERRARADERRNQEVRPEKLERMPEEHVKRELGWFSGGSTGAYSESFLADPSQDYDKWAQAYRFLGGYIDCDHCWGEDGHHSGSGDNDDEDQAGCSRWMIYATYINPNYQGNEYYEYFCDSGEDEADASNCETPGKLDCHNPDSDWVLMGVFRQEHYQFIEQISKHLWAITEYDYVVALAGLAYMTDEECFVVGGDDGDYLYVGVQPIEGGDTQVALYTDEMCLLEDDSGLTPDDFGLGSDVDLGSKDEESSIGYAYEWWYDAQEYTLTDMNEVYRPYQYCTACIDYPTYQDGYFIGDYGTDDDDVINQCWKFWSHDAFICEHDCLSKANAQGTILQIDYGDRSYGYSPDSYFSGYSAVRSASKATTSSSSSNLESPLARLLANAFLTLTFLLFVATFLAFAVARRSRYRESRSSRSRRLLDDDHASRRSSSRRRSKSRGASGGGDGLFRDSASRSRARSSRSRGASSRRKAYDPEE